MRGVRTSDNTQKREMTTQFGIHQQVFMLFFAIFWGATANVQPRWKAFQFPLVFKRGLRWNVCRRVCLALLLLNLIPILYFGYVLFVTSLPGRGPADTDAPLLVVGKILVQGVVPALGMFGIYRLWLAIVELRPSLFYKSKPDEVPEEYRHVEPTYRLDFRDKRFESEPVVDLGSDAGRGNLLAALAYLLVAMVSPWLL